jgi:hypothetical protein
VYPVPLALELAIIPVGNARGISGGLSIDMADRGYMLSLSFFDYTHDVMATWDRPIDFSDTRGPVKAWQLRTDTAATRTNHIRRHERENGAEFLFHRSSSRAEMGTHANSDWWKDVRYSP